MKKELLFCCICIVIAWSCAREDENEGKTIQKPAGRYLSEIRTNINPLSPKDSFRLVEFEYDHNRFLKTVRHYIPETQQLKRHDHLFYNSDGLLDHIEAHYGASDAMIDERFTYENRKPVLRESYRIVDSKTTLVGKAVFKVNSENKVIEIHPYDFKEGEFVERTAYQKYHFDAKGNLTKYHYNIDEGGFFETMEDFEYDNMNSPFANFEIRYYNIVSPYFYFAECFSMNNVVKHKNYLHENGMSYEKPLFDTIIYKYEGSYPVESIEYEYNGKTPVKIKSQYFFKYVDLK